MRPPPTQRAVTPTRRIACQSAKSRQPRIGMPLVSRVSRGSTATTRGSVKNPRYISSTTVNRCTSHQVPLQLDRLAGKRGLHSRDIIAVTEPGVIPSNRHGRQRDELDEEDKACPVELNTPRNEQIRGDRRNDQRALLPGEEGQRRDARPGNDQPAIDSVQRDGSCIKPGGDDQERHEMGVGHEGEGEHEDERIEEERATPSAPRARATPRSRQSP